MLYSRVYGSNSKNLLIFNTTELYKNQKFENRTFDSVRLYIFLCEFDLVRLPNSIELKPRIEFDWNSVRLGSIYYAGSITLRNYACIVCFVLCGRNFASSKLLLPNQGLDLTLTKITHEKTGIKGIISDGAKNFTLCSLFVLLPHFRPDVTVL